MWHPWRELRALERLVFEVCPDLPSGNAWWSPAHEVILMRPGLLQVERRCALAHELGHRTLGHSGTCSYADAHRQSRRAEHHADRWAARKLIDLPRLTETVRWTSDLEEAAEELWVTPQLLRVRFAGLHVAERNHLQRVAEGRDHED